MNDKTILLTSTYPTKEDALLAGDAVVKLRLAACAQISSPITSIYHWKDQLKKGTEFRLVLKTTASNEPNLVNYLRANHPYDLPEIIVTEIKSGSKEFLNWINTDTS